MRVRVTAEVSAVVSWVVVTVPSMRVRSVICGGEVGVGDGILAINAMNGYRVQFSEFETTVSHS